MLAAVVKIVLDDNLGRRKFMTLIRIFVSLQCETTTTGVAVSKLEKTSCKIVLKLHRTVLWALTVFRFKRDGKRRPYVRSNARWCLLHLCIHVLRISVSLLNTRRLRVSMSSWQYIISYFCRRRRHNHWNLKIFRHGFNILKSVGFTLMWRSSNKCKPIVNISRTVRET